MSDLISREMVIDILKQTGIIQDNDIGHCVIEEINRIPIAYDIDKVVEELENLKDKGSVTKTEMLITKSCIDKAIEIVKQGSVGKDVE